MNIFGIQIGKRTIYDHPAIRVYRRRMRKQGRCIQCINPWYDGTCGCGKSGKEQSEIEALAAKLNDEGWWKI